MPIRFACPHCGQKLSVPEEKSGLAARCPKCRQSLVIPVLRVESAAVATKSVAASRVPAPAKPTAPQKSTSATKAAGLPAPSPQPTTSQPATSQPATSQLATSQPATSQPATSQPPVPRPSPPAYDEFDEIAWLYAEGDSRPARAATSVGKPSATWIVVTQAVLLLVMLATGYGLGLVSRRKSAPKADGTSSQPVALTGRITYGTSGGTQFPDEGAVVLAVPSSQRPAVDEKLAYEGLRPIDLPLDARHPTLERLRVLGGAYARADANGEFRLALPRGGAYHLLIVSSHGARRAQTSPNKSDLAQIGRYVTMASEMIGDRRYRWRLEELTGARRIEELLPY